MIELLGVLLLIGVIAGLVYSSIGSDSKEDMAWKVGDKNIIAGTLQTAIFEVKVSDGDLSDATKADLVTAGAPAHTSAGGVWTLTGSTANSVTISWVTAGTHDGPAFGAGLVESLTNLANPGFLAATPPVYVAANNAVTLVFTLR